MIVLFFRARNLKTAHFLCRPDDKNMAIMCPIEKACTNFSISTPKNHKEKNPGTVPLYKVVQKSKSTATNAISV